MERITLADHMSQNEQYAAARRAWDEWTKSRLALPVHPDDMISSSFALFLESNWAWPAFKAGWDAARNIQRQPTTTATIQEN